MSHINYLFDVSTNDFRTSVHNTMKKNTRLYLLETKNKYKIIPTYPTEKRNH